MTSCPPEIAKILLETIGWGLLRIRALGWSGQADQCIVEADHLHNLPDLLAKYDPMQLVYYGDVERVCYMDATTPEFAAALQPLWGQLEPHVEAIRRTIEHS
jgi:hypothetical protein